MAAIEPRKERCCCLGFSMEGRRSLAFFFPLDSMRWGSRGLSKGLPPVKGKPNDRVG